MSTNNKHKISEKELDNLLGQAFLNLDFNNPKNQELMETISHQVLPTSPVSAGIINKALFTKLMVLIAIMSTSIFIYINYFSNTKHETIKNTSTTNVSSVISEQIIETPKQEIIASTNNDIIETKKENQPVISLPAQQQESEINESPKHQIPTTSYIDESKKVKNEDTNYVFPKLTEKEIKETKKQKEVMAAMLVRPNKYWYPLIGDKQSVSVFGNINDTNSVFYMARAEVTNLEYRTFLFDLLLHEEKEAFIKAKPHQYLWLDAPGHAKHKEMKDNYFSDKKYNDYPVVNITPEGAELYCKWLSNLTKTNNGNIVARLPYESEWIKAVKGKDKQAIYPWPGDSIQNKLGCFLANFCIQKQSEKLRPNHHIKCSAKNPNAYTSAEYMLGDSMMTTQVYAYNPNDYGVYCMIGNVAEMVYSNKTKTVITKGGSWNSDFEQCKIYNHEELDGKVKANPMTGFRPVFRICQTHSFGSIQRDIPETGLQQLTEEEIISAQKEKKKMMEALVKFNKDKYALIPMGSYIYKNDTVSVQSFYMETTEVNNLEYRTFLADLLIQNRTADYLLAKPNQEAWVTKFPWSFNEPMRDMYFWHPAYDEYPVVNVSRRGAEMYCEWLTTETNNYLKANNKPLINDLRIPVDIEWAYAASNKLNKVKYATGHEQLRDSKGKYEMNYMCYSKEQCRYDSVINLYVPKIAKRTLAEETHQAIIDDGAFHTAYTRSYTSNSYGLYCMAGNVAEMVYNFDLKSKKIKGKGTKGGSWFSCDYYLEIDAGDEYPNEEGPSPLIGFRPVMTALKTK
ncbi:MAG TPA: SUMF1/EgtB/PvdO family nonheme iron enzyme [Bacteroidia bacterium]|nr:SUMF1/EgtB/PvdO family nonheme iron enzyme [Bacteroidia bacterium]